MNSKSGYLNITSAALLARDWKLYSFNMHVQTLNNYLFNIQKYASVKHQHDWKPGLFCKIKTKQNLR